MRGSAKAITFHLLKVLGLIMVILISGCSSPVSTSDSESLSAPPHDEENSVPSFQASFMFSSVTPPDNIMDSSDRTILAVGSGLSESEARSDALSALSMALYSQIESLVETKEYVLEADGQVTETESSISQNSIVSTNLPILGAEISIAPRISYDENRKRNIYLMDAILKASTALPLYEEELKKLSTLMADAESILEKTADTLLRMKQLSQLLSYSLQYEKLAYVAHALGSLNIPPVEYSPYAIEAELLKLRSVNDSYERAAENLTRTVMQDNVHIYPAKLNGSGGITEFSEQLSLAISNVLKSRSVSDPKKAKYFLIGTYTLKDDGNSGIYVTYRLEDRNGNVLSISMEELLPSAYEGQRFIPVAYDFQKQLERGNSIDTGFSVDIRINGMKDYLTFKTEDELTIEVRASAPCYFYVVGYVFNEQDETFSYLFPLTLDASGKEMFIHRVSPEDVNKWIIINPSYGGNVLPIEIIEPYGVEMLQVYASTDRNYQAFLDTVPGFQETEDYYLVADDPEEGLMLTRALNVKNITDQTEGTVRKAEASVSFKSGK